VVASRVHADIVVESKAALPTVEKALYDAIFDRRAAKSSSRKSGQHAALEPAQESKIEPQINFS
jgi:hypothetical protein